MQRSYDVITVLYYFKAPRGGMQMRRAASFFAKLVILLIPSLTDGLSEMTPAQLLAWPDNSYDRYIAVDKESLNGIC